MKRQRARRRIAAFLVGALLVVMAMPCYAEANPLHKLGRGIVNLATSWIEVPKAIHEESKASNPFIGLTYGAIKGAGECVIRTGAAAYDAGTFILPKYDKPLLKPEYVF